VLNRAVAWGLLDVNPAKHCVPNTQRRPKGEAAVRILGADRRDRRSARTGARTDGDLRRRGGLRPSELFGLEQHDVDRQSGVVYVRRAYANGRIKNTKTRLSTRAVPLQAKAVEALDRLPVLVNPILFPDARGGRGADRPRRSARRRDPRLSCARRRGTPFAPRRTACVMFKAIILLARREGATREGFREWWLGRHPELARDLPGLRGLRFNLVEGDGAFDGVSELWFDSQQAFHEAYASEHGRRVAEDSLANASRRECLFVSEHVLKS